MIKDAACFWSYETQNIFLKTIKSLDFSKFRAQFIPFNNWRWEKRIFEKNVSDVKAEYIICIPCSIIECSHGN